MKKKVVQQKWKKRVFALILVVVLCFGSLLFMQMRYTHVLGLVSLQHQFVSQVQKPTIAFLFIARNRLPLELVWDAFFRIDWGEASMIEAERILLRHALDDPLDGRYVFLSDRKSRYPNFGGIKSLYVVLYVVSFFSFTRKGTMFLDQE